MATTLTASVSAKVGWNFENVLDWGNALNSATFSYTKSLASGTAASQVDVLYVAQGTIAASTNLDLDLAASLADMFGHTITFARVKTLYVELTTDTTSTGLWVGGASSNGFANWISSAGTFGTDQPRVKVRNGGAFFLSAPDATAYAVTAGTGDILRLTNADGSNVATYKLAVTGASA